MKINEAIAKRINDLCNDPDLANKVANSDNISTNKLASLSLLTQSTVQHLTDGRSKNPKMLTIARICRNGLDIKIKDFFDDPIFDDVDLED
ncbi:MAG: helix-turn-helix domain-containing protein [Bacilli bacterium]